MKSKALFFICALIWVLHLTGCNFHKAPSVPELEAGEVVSTTATVAAIDYAEREVTLVGAGGNAVTVSVGEDAYNFDQVEVGDLVDIVYRQSVTVNLEKTAGDLSAVSDSGITKAPKGQKPEAAIYNVIEVKARVEHIDYEKRTIDIRGPYGNLITTEVDESVKNFETIKAGDNVVARYTEAAAISVRPAEKK